MKKLLTFLTSWISCKQRQARDPLPARFRNGDIGIQVDSMNEVEQLFEIMQECGINDDYAYLSESINDRGFPERPICIIRSWVGYDWTYADGLKRRQIVPFRNILQHRGDVFDVPEIINFLDN